MNYAFHPYFAYQKTLYIYIYIYILGRCKISIFMTFANSVNALPFDLHSFSR